MKPYYETALGKLYHGDCLEIMPTLKNASIILTDPPYGKNIAKTGTLGGDNLAKAKQYTASEWDIKPPPRIAFELMRSKSTHQIIFGANYFSNYLPPSPCWLVWDKETTGNFADCEIAYTSFPLAVRKVRWMWNGMLKRAPEERHHPTQKPVGLFQLILDRYCKEWPNTLDPYLGSGTTAIACERLNRKWIGIEISEEYCEIAAKRIEQETKQLKLF